MLRSFLPYAVLHTASMGFGVRFLRLLTLFVFCRLLLLRTIDLSLGSHTSFTSFPIISPTSSSSSLELTMAPSLQLPLVRWGISHGGFGYKPGAVPSSDADAWAAGIIDEDEDNSTGPPRKKLRLTKEQSRLLEESFRENQTSTPVSKNWESQKDCYLGIKFKEAKVTILRDVSGIIKPSRMTLLLGPPGCGKTTLLRALSGRLDHSLQVERDVSYNGFKLEDFIPQKTSAYVSQHDLLHIPELTVRKTLYFSARCQGSGSRAEDLLVELEKREKEAGIVPNSDLDAYMKAISISGAKRTPETDYILKVLGLETCSDVIIGDAMKKGISGGEKKCLTLDFF